MPFANALLFVVPGVGQGNSGLSGTMMKNLIRSIALLIGVACTCGAAYADAVPTGVAGVPWGASKPEVMQMMRDKGFAEHVAPELQAETGGRDVLEFDGFFDNQNCHYIFMFNNGQMTGGDVAFIRYSLVGAMALYHRFTPVLADKYGSYQARTEEASGNFPYAVWSLHDLASGDDYTITTFIDHYYFEGPSLETRVYSFVITYIANSLDKRTKPEL